MEQANQSKTLKLLVLDPGTSTGYCLVTLTQEAKHYTKADIYEYGFIDVDITSDYQGDHCISLMNKIKKLIEFHAVNHIAVEDYFFSNRFRNGSNVNGAFRTAIHILARQNDIEYTILNISSWKTFVAGRSTPAKHQKAKWGIHSKKLYMQEALWINFGFRFPNHSISQTTNKPISFRFDIVDVVAQAVYFCGLIKGIGKANITMSVKHAPDYKWKKPPKHLFLYPDN